MTRVSSISTERQFMCAQCGAALTYEPGTESLVCGHCGSKVAIPPSSAPIENLDYERYASSVPAEEDQHEQLTVRCTTCGAETHLGPNVTADKCVFCGSPIVAEAKSRRLIKPQALLPFAAPRKKAEESFHQWLAGLWFAPRDLAKQANCGNLMGAYVPCWTFNANCLTEYSGERGEDYTTEETYTETVNGRPVTRTRMVTKTRWWPCSGSVENHFQDLMVMASTTLPPKQAAHLEPWDLNHLVSYNDEFLAGFAAESYQVDLPHGFAQAKEQSVPEIRRTIDGDIGGNHQRINSMASRYFDVTFRHILLPLWISAYFYNGKSYRFLVNARSGEVQGERPYSAGKIAGLVILILIGVVIAVVTFNRN